MNKKVGVYLPKERSRRILRAKMKKFIWSLKHPIFRRYEGRSLVAKNKLRLKGKFVKNNNERKIFSVIKTDI
jgi:hypothetical protein